MQGFELAIAPVDRVIDTAAHADLVDLRKADVQIQINGAGEKLIYGEFLVAITRFDGSSRIDRRSDRHREHDDVEQHEEN